MPVISSSYGPGQAGVTSPSSAARGWMESAASCMREPGPRRGWHLPGELPMTVVTGPGWSRPRGGQETLRIGPASATSRSSRPPSLEPAAPLNRPAGTSPPGGTLLHVKDVDRPSPASHLLAQALVSADALLNDEEARAQFLERVQLQSGTTVDVPDRISTVVLGVARKGNPLTSDSLFTFTQVTMVRLVDLLHGRGVDVFIQPIRRGRLAHFPTARPSRGTPTHSSKIRTTSQQGSNGPFGNGANAQVEDLFCTHQRPGGCRKPPDSPPHNA
jgi:hypothetical protein